MKEKRLQLVEEFIQEKGTASLDELCEHFNVSKNTIRRDINKILENGTIQKVYGGVTTTSDRLIPFENRDHSNQEEKQIIGEIAAGYIEEDEIIFIDSGTTTRNIIEFLPKGIKVTLLTNSLDIINAAATLENINLIIIGNNYKRKTKSFVGMDDSNTIDKYNVNKAFMAATGVSISHGLTNSDLLEYEIKKRIVSKTEDIFLLADQSKYDKSTLLTYCPLEDVSTIVTAQPLSEEYTAFCEEHNIQIATK
ncbi:IolR protein [Listeria weihenstephanensis FSL R9-0317]|uniref:DeoR faimly transcriptional regulator n=1 Tax=Listeria weihenstephanensis TaxID=1006155 RepID=A0A1S7FWX4_9LIST|nr:DeoR/GlpR family DNA-binding transcription regulator [Listeria weihenstephanensis]AQY51892.1 DeoR faimly transcriptional regulator [Listeria weihenstephanensis]EUJ40721.1 IolR protein [Listeria weihenstephanensis FSL R9-0317]